jgi:hypothetical protein
VQLAFLKRVLHHRFDKAVVVELAEKPLGVNQYRGRIVAEEAIMPPSQGTLHSFDKQVRLYYLISKLMLTHKKPAGGIQCP